MAKRASAERLQGWHLLILSLMTLVFALQSYVTQTHIHIPSAETASLGFFPANKSTPAVGQTAERGGKTRQPANDDPANCPICQEILHSGQFITPSAIVFALPTEAIALIPMALLPLAARKSASHSWQGRAPPRI